MCKFCFTTFLLLLLTFNNLIAQTSESQLFISNDNVHQVVSTFIGTKDIEKADLSFAELGREMRRYSYTDSNITRAEINREAVLVPGILYGLGAGAAYFGVHKVLYGDLANANYKGLFLSSVGGIVLGAIINSNKRSKARQRILNRRKSK